MRRMECDRCAYLYYFVPDRPVTDGVPQSGVSVMPAGQELRFGGMDGQSPELISVTLQRSETNGRSLTHRPARRSPEATRRAYRRRYPRPRQPPPASTSLGRADETPEAQEGCVV